MPDIRKGFLDVSYHYCFPYSPVGKESACNSGDPSSIPGSGRSAGERIGYPLQYCWASLMAQPVKNQPAMWETWVRSLGCEDPLEKGYPLQYSGLENSMEPQSRLEPWSHRVGRDWATFTSFPDWHTALGKFKVCGIMIWLASVGLTLTNQLQTQGLAWASPWWYLSTVLPWSTANPIQYHSNPSLGPNQ